MNKRKLISETNNGNSICYEATYDDGKKQINYCTKKDWDIWLIKDKLIFHGANIDDVEKLISLCYSNGYDDAELTD